MSVADSQVLVFKCWSLIQFRAPVFGPQKSGLGPSATWVCGCCCQALPYLPHPSTTYWLLWVGGIVATEDRVPRESWRRGHPQPDLCGTEQVPHGLVLSPFSRPGLPTKS